MKRPKQLYVAYTPITSLWHHKLSAIAHQYTARSAHGLVMKLLSSQESLDQIMAYQAENSMATLAEARRYVIQTKYGLIPHEQALQADKLHGVVFTIEVPFSGDMLDKLKIVAASRNTKPDVLVTAMAHAWVMKQADKLGDSE